MNQTKIKTSLLLACGLVLTALPSAFAESHPGRHTAEGMFKAADTNNDNKVSRTEHVAGGKMMFAEMDTNRDGTVNLAEMTAAQAANRPESALKGDRPGNADRQSQAEKSAMADKSPAAMIKQHDKNADGQLSAAEHTAGCDAMFTKMDTNSDDSLSKEECREGDKMAKNLG